MATMYFDWCRNQSFLYVAHARSLDQPEMYCFYNYLSARLMFMSNFIADFKDVIEMWDWQAAFEFSVFSRLIR